MAIDRRPPLAVVAGTDAPAEAVAEPAEPEESFTPSTPFLDPSSGRGSSFTSGSPRMRRKFWPPKAAQSIPPAVLRAARGVRGAGRGFSGAGLTA